jgi:hypothetical protein
MVFALNRVLLALFSFQRTVSPFQGGKCQSYRSMLLLSTPFLRFSRIFSDYHFSCRSGKKLFYRFACPPSIPSTIISEFFSSALTVYGFFRGFLFRRAKVFTMSRSPSQVLSFLSSRYSISLIPSIHTPFTLPASTFPHQLRQIFFPIFNISSFLTRKRLYTCLFPPLLPQPPEARTQSPRPLGWPSNPSENTPL